MAKSSKPTIQKREKEKARVQKAIEKNARRADNKGRRSDVGGLADGEDPDLVGIIAGPQPLPPERGGPMPEE